jgi:hypothetical protein
MTPELNIMIAILVGIIIFVVPIIVLVYLIRINSKLKKVLKIAEED